MLAETLSECLRLSCLTYIQRNIWPTLKYTDPNINPSVLITKFTLRLKFILKLKSVSPFRVVDDCCCMNEFVFFKKFIEVHIFYSIFKQSLEASNLITLTHIPRTHIHFFTGAKG